MEKRRARRLAGGLLAAIAATLLAPLAALGRTPSPSRAAHPCHCPVKMACCEAGLCHGGEDDGPSSSPSWSGCRDEAPPGADLLAPSNAFDTALAESGTPLPGPSAFRASLVVCAATEPGSPAPSTPPPRGDLARS